MRFPPHCPVLLAGLAAACASAQEGWLGDRVQLDAGLWWTTGEANWTERGSELASPLIDRYRSELKYEDIDSLLLTLGAEVKLSDSVRVKAMYGSGSIDDATGTDGDWVDGARLPREIHVSESRHDLDGDTDLWEAALLWRLPIEREDLVLDGFVSVGRYRDGTRSTNARQTLLDEQPLDVSISGLNSTYDFEWTSVKVGVEGEYRTANNCYLCGRLAIAPYVDYQGEAFWNLREDFKRTPPNFVHDANTGVGLEAKLGAGYRWKRVEFEAGYWWFMYDVEDGTSETFFVDGTSSFSGLEADAERGGVYGQVGVRF